MGMELQKASLWKRLSAWLLDFILLTILITGSAALLAEVLGYNSYSQTVADAYEKYEAQYGMSFQMSPEDYAALPEAEQANYQAAYEALVADREAMYAYNMSMNLILLIATASILLGYVVLEFLLPLLLKNGQTMGKKIFSLGLVRSDSVKMNTMQLFVRTFLGKYTIGTMLPVYILILMFQGKLGLLGTVLLAILTLTQVILVLFTRNHTPLQDMMAGTVLVEISSQRVFETTEELIEYTKRIHAERAERQPY